jgi:chitodextrinase
VHIRKLTILAAVAAVLPVLLAGSAHGGAAITIRFGVKADTYTSFQSPHKTHGSLTYLKVDGTPRTTYLRFAVSGLADPVVRATLRVYPLASSSIGFSVHTTTDSWNESTLTYSNAPEISPTVVSSSGSLTGYTWVSVDVSSVVRGNGVYSLALTGPAALRLASREHWRHAGAQLLLEESADTTAPTAPSNLAVSQTTVSSISLSWSQSFDPEGVAGYTIYNGGARVGSTSSTSFTVPNLTCGASSTLSVDAYDAAGNRSSKVSVVAATSPCPSVDTQPPTPPAQLSVTGATDTSVSAGWQASTDNVGVAGYKLYVNSSSAGQTSGTTYKFASLTCGTSYVLGLEAFDAAGNVSARSTTQGSTAACAPAPGIGPSSGSWFGIYPKGRNGRSHQEELAYVESEIGRKFNVDHYYLHFDYGFPRAEHLGSIASGHTLLVNLKPEISDVPALWAEIAAGKYDAYLVDKAKGFKSLGVPVFVAFHHEPENDPEFGTPGGYVAAWRHIVSVFDSQGASNVVWVWNLMSWSWNPSSDRDPAAYYPGDDVIDWLAADGYNWYPCRAGDPWKSFGEIFSTWRSWAVTNHPNKPLMIAETGTPEDPSDANRKAQWFTDMARTLQAWPEIKAVVYFNADSDSCPTRWLDSTPTSELGYEKIGLESFFNPF